MKRAKTGSECGARRGEGGGGGKGERGKRESVDSLEERSDGVFTQFITRDTHTSKLQASYSFRLYIKVQFIRHFSCISVAFQSRRM